MLYSRSNRSMLSFGSIHQSCLEGIFFFFVVVLFFNRTQQQQCRIKFSQYSDFVYQMQTLTYPANFVKFKLPDPLPSEWTTSKYGEFYVVVESGDDEFDNLFFDSPLFSSNPSVSCDRAKTVSWWKLLCIVLFALNRIALIVIADDCEWPCNTCDDCYENDNDGNDNDDDLHDGSATNDVIVCY